MKVVFLTDGPSRLVRVGPMTIQLRRTTPRNMAAAGRLSGLVIQAFRHLGKDDITTERVAHLKRTVKLEFGLLTDQQPTERHPVRPWIVEVLEEAFDDWRCNVVALDVHRTFWEKATILHSEHHRPADKPTPDRFSRHYADTVALAQDRVASTAVGQGDEDSNSNRKYL